MQNLKDIDHRVFNFEKTTAPLTATAWDLSDGSLIYAFGPSETDPLLSLKRLRPNAFHPEQSETIAAWDALSPIPDLPCDKILDLHCFSDTRTLVLILAGGDIVLVREEPESGEDVVEIVGSVDAGIAAAAWSPDEELVVIATKADTVLLMTRNFESTADIALSADDLKVSNHVSVGWGKSETQFKGRGAKALRDPTLPEYVDAGILSPYDDGKVSISWRGDGQYIAVNSILDLAPQRRVIRIFNRDGVLESVSEPVDGLESALSWKPSGQLLAGIQRRNDRTDVVFFERNGLRHGEFDLRIPNVTTPIDLKWNIDSTVLAVILADRLQLWTSSNYRWYLKQETRIPRSTTTRPVIAWHQEKSLLLSYGSQDVLHTACYAFQYSFGSCTPPNDVGLVASIDGRRLDLTPLRIANVPPPMAYDGLDLETSIVDIAFDKSGRRIAILHHDTVSILASNYEQKPASMIKLRSSFTLSKEQVCPRQIVFQADGSLVVLSAPISQEQSISCTYDIDGIPTSTEQTLPSQITMLIQSDYGVCSFYESNGSISMFHPTSELLGSLPASCTVVDVWQDKHHRILFGMTATGVLHIRSEVQQLKVSGCTSFLITQSYLIYTTSQHLLKFVHLHGGDLELPADEPEKDERCRNIERGAKIVTAMPTSFALVLQMPRGNLETIYPRALVLAGIRQSILVRDYKKAFLICRSHRVDMNIIYDYAPAQFLQDVGLFIKQVKKIEYIDLFLSSLSEENTTQTIYRETMQATADDEKEPAVPLALVGSKINHICDAFLSALQQAQPVSLQNVITAHVCKNPPGLEAALRLVADLQKTASEREIEQAVEHVCFLADVNQLYDTALGLYELEVTLLVAQQTQKDPREYLPYLQGLKKMEAKRQQFTIDNDLKRYTKALTHLHGMGVFDELTTYMVRHQLYSTAIELYRHDKQRLPLLMQSYANFLVSRNQYGDAAVLFEYVQDYRAANEAYRSANMWRESLTTAALVPLSDSEIQSLAETIADAQEEAKDFTAAAVIHLDYLEDLRGAVRLHCKAYDFAEASRLAVLRKSPELLEEIVDPGLVECSASMTELLAEMKGQINAQVPRLRELRQKKLEEPMAYLNAGEGEDGDIPDNLSVAPTDASTSGGTFMTRYTNRSNGTIGTNVSRKTSKNRRREERKRAKGKKGTVYEEEYLVNSISRLIERLNTTNSDITKLVQGLMRRAMRERAVAVEYAMAEVWELCHQHMDEVYGTSKDKAIFNDQQDEQQPGSQRPWGGQGVLWDSLTASQGTLTAPVLTPFLRAGMLTS